MRKYYSASIGKTCQNTFITEQSAYDQGNRDAHAQFVQQPFVTYIIPGPLHRATLIAIDARVNTL